MKKRPLSAAIAPTQTLFFQDIDSGGGGVQGRDGAIRPQKRIALGQIITPADSQAKENYGKLALYF